MSLHQHRRYSLRRGLLAIEGRGDIAFVAEAATFEQQAGQRGDQQVGLVAVVEGFEHRADPSTSPGA